VTVHLSPEDLAVLDQWQNSFGLDSRALAAVALMRAGSSAVPLNTAVFEISQASVREHRRFFTDALARFFEEQAATLRGTRP
jgi:hypothetical protein